MFHNTHGSVLERRCMWLWLCGVFDKCPFDTVSGGLSVLLRPCQPSVYQFCRFRGEEPESPAVIWDLSIFLLASFRFYPACLEALASYAYTFRTVLPCWQSNRLFIRECPALSRTGSLVLKSTLPNINRAAPAFLSLAFAWSLFSPT